MNKLTREYISQFPDTGKIQVSVPPPTADNEQYKIMAAPVGAPAPQSKQTVIHYQTYFLATHEIYVRYLQER